MRSLVLPAGAPLKAVWRKELLGGVTAIECVAPRLRAVPNFVRLNRGGWFGYGLAVDAKAKNVLLCTYWGSDVGNRRFSILVGGKKIAAQTLQRNRPGEFFYVEYAIPDALTRGRAAIAVKLQADPGATAGGAFDLRVLRGPQQTPQKPRARVK